MTQDDEMGPSDREVAAIIEALDALVDAVERHKASLEGEQPDAHGSGDAHYVKRVDRGVVWCDRLLDTLDEQVLDQVGGLRHNAHQLGLAREGRMV